MRVARIVPKKHFTLIPIGISRGHDGINSGMTRSCLPEAFRH